MQILDDANEIELKVYEALKKVIDPEIGINIIDLGLVYKIECSHDNGILIEMTFSTKACPMGDAIIQNIENEIKSVFPDLKLEIQLIWDPEWSTAMVTEEGKIALGMN